MTIQNQFGVRDIQQRHDAYEAGTKQGPGFDNPYTNPLIEQISTSTLTASADVSDEIVEAQVFTTTITDPDGLVRTATYTVDAADAAAATDALGLSLMAQRVAESINAEATLTNIVTATSTTGDTTPGVVTITWSHPDRGAWTAVLAIAPAAAEQTLLVVNATPQNAGGVFLPMARFVAYGVPVGGGKRRAILPTAGSVITGVALRDITQPRGTSTLLAAADEYPPGVMVSVREHGNVAMRNADPAAVVAGDPVHVIVDATGGGIVGEARASRDGVAQITTATPTVANATTYQLTVSIAAQDGLPALTRPFTILSDGAATDIEICDAFKAAMALDAEFTSRITTDAAGGTTLVLTGVEAGIAFTVLDTQEGVGDWTSIVLTQAPVAFTQALTHAHWDDRLNAGQVGQLAIRTLPA